MLLGVERTRVQKDPPPDTPHFCPLLPIARDILYSLDDEWAIVWNRKRVCFFDVKFFFCLLFQQKPLDNTRLFKKKTIIVGSVISKKKVYVILKNLNCPQGTKRPPPLILRTFALYRPSPIARRYFILLGRWVGDGRAMTWLSTEN